MRKVQIILSSCFFLFTVIAAAASDTDELFHASAKGDVRAIETILKKGADINHKGSEGMTPLAIAVISKQAEAVRYLVKSGLDVNIKDYMGMKAISGLLKFWLQQVLMLILQMFQGSQRLCSQLRTGILMLLNFL
jgi:ankyrin repeat protein